MSGEGAQAQLYLVTPPILSLEPFGEVLAELLDAVEVACVRLALASSDEDELMRAADSLRAICHARDVPLVVAEHFRLAARLGLDGVHLQDGSRRIRAAREALGPMRSWGPSPTPRGTRMTAAEIGADYVGFGPLAASALGTGRWRRASCSVVVEMIETPVVAEGGLTLETAGEIGRIADFLALREEVWSAPDPLAALRGFAERLG